jgi:predicted NAD-dependent protein-ADP-ribosyltransferase YbiA (DUF1768 family)
MRVILEPGTIIVAAESALEQDSIVSWARELDDHVFVLRHQDTPAIRMTDLGIRQVACREPINVTSDSSDPEVRLISNFAHTPFVLDSLEYASVEAFWQGLKFPDESHRREIAPLHGKRAKRAGKDATESVTVSYQGRDFRTGTFEHWSLMRLACAAKFTQHEEAGKALLNTGRRPIFHKTRRDSMTIPGVIMADIWMEI